MRWSLVVALLVGGCSSSPPGMVPRAPVPHAEDARLTELARIHSSPDRRALLVVYPRSACSGSASMVLMTDNGRFLGAIAPGSAALLDVAASDKTLLLVSSVEIAAPKGLIAFIDDVDVPAAPDGLVLESKRLSMRQCGSGQYASARRASKSELELTLAESDVQWLATHESAGQAWLDANRPRVRELLASRR